MAAQDYTDGYIEVDGGTDNVSIDSATEISFNSLARNEETHISKSLGAGNFTDFEHLHSAKITARDVSSIATVYALGNSADDGFALRNDDSIIIRFFHAAGPNENRINLLNTDAGAVKINDSFQPFVLNTHYGFKTKRLGTAISCKIYDDGETRSNLIDTILGTGVADTYEFHLPLAAWNDGGGSTITGIVYETDFQETVAVIKTIVHKMLGFSLLKVFTTNNKDHSL